MVVYVKTCIKYRICTHYVQLHEQQSLDWQNVFPAN